jgi:flagellar L-ring protein precursor FlgH
MNKTNMVTGAVGLAVAMTMTAGAQTTPQRQSTPAAEQRPAKGGSNDRPAFTGTEDAMDRSDGSLMQAGIAQATPEQQGKASAYNAIAVPEPEPHVYKKHDLVNIIVSEEQKSSSTSAADSQRQVDFDAKTDAFVRFSAAKFSVIGGAEGANPPEIKLEGQRDYKYAGDAARTDSVTLRLEAEVVDVRPNGTMVLQARRHIQNDEEDVKITLTGTCRVQDIDAANSVLSTDIHDLDFNKQTKGGVKDAATRGFIPRLLDFFNPF